MTLWVRRRGRRTRTRVIREADQSTARARKSLSPHEHRLTAACHPGKNEPPAMAMTIPGRINYETRRTRAIYDSAS